MKNSMKHKTEMQIDPRSLIVYESELKSSVRRGLPRHKTRLEYVSGQVFAPNTPLIGKRIVSNPLTKKCRSIGVLKIATVLAGCLAGWLAG